MDPRHGKTRRAHAYYACAPRKGQPVPDGHPASLWVNEAALVDGLHEFLAEQVFGNYRRTLLADTVARIDSDARAEHTRRVAAAEKAVRDNEHSRRRLLRVLEVTDDPDPELMRDITTRRAELGSEHRELTAELTRLAELEHQQPNPELLDTLPVGACDIATLPEPVARRLFEAFRLEIHFDKTRHSALYRITLTGDTLPTAHVAAAVQVGAEGQRPAAETPEIGAAAAPFPSVWCTQQGIMRTRNCR